MALKPWRIEVEFHGDVVATAELNDLADAFDVVEYEANRLHVGIHILTVRIVRWTHDNEPPEVDGSAVSNREHCRNS